MFTSRQASPVKSFTFGTPFSTSKINELESNNIFGSAGYEEEMIHHQEMSSSKITLNHRNLKQSNYDAFKTPSNQSNLFNYKKGKETNTPELLLKKLIITDLNELFESNVF